MLEATALPDVPQILPNLNNCSNRISKHKFELNWIGILVVPSSRLILYHIEILKAQGFLSTSVLILVVDCEGPKWQNRQ